MKKILVFNVAAEHSGALTVLEEFYDIAKNDKFNNWHFILSLPKFEETENIKITNYKWVKRNWLFRILFDYIVSPYIIIKDNPDEILSLQNLTIPFRRQKQIVYIQQSLPFVDIKYSFKESKIIWFYQNLYSKFIFKSIKKSKKVIVQTLWMKNAIINKLNTNPSKIKVMPINNEIKTQGVYEKQQITLFFYPANASIYKNHEIIIKAATMLKKERIDEYEIIFTLTGQENNKARILKQQVELNKLPIKFVGKMTKDKVYEMYRKSILIFPSKIETVGLPLLEALGHKSPIIVSDLPFSKEVLEGYDRCHFFEHSNYVKLYEIMKEYVLKDNGGI